MPGSTSRLAEKKLIILYLVKKMGIPLSNSEICQFALEKNYMDYFSVQQYLAELVDAGFLDKNKENNNTRYTVTDEGSEILGFFIKHISDSAKNVINTYVHENNKRIRAEYEVTANYFLQLNNEYLVKLCVVDSDGSSLMEISAVAATKEQARIICQNWKGNANKLYGSILSLLITEPKKEKPTES